MRIWLVQIGELLPIDRGSPRLIRTALLADVLHRRGHEVTYWASTFEYREKVLRAERDVSIQLPESYRLQLVHAGGFSGHFSIGRIRYHARVAARFRERAKDEPLPDIIVCGFPTIELSAACVEFGEKHGIPVVLDVRDLWPETFTRAAPKVLEPFVKLAITPFVRKTRNAFRRATALCGITQPIVGWATTYAGRNRTERDKWFPHGYPTPTLTAEQREAGLLKWRTLGIEVGKTFVVCYIGGLHSVLELETVLDAAHLLESSCPRIRFVIAGTGSQEARLRRLAASRSNVVFSGWIGSEEIWTLMELASVGLVCYRSHFDFEASIPNKPIEYMAGGLAVLSSLERGVLKDLLEERHCGMSYRNGSPQQLAAIIRNLCEEPLTTESMGKNGQRVYRELFDAETVYNGMAAHLEKLHALSSEGSACV